MFLKSQKLMQLYVCIKIKKTYYNIYNVYIEFL